MKQRSRSEIRNLKDVDLIGQLFVVRVVKERWCQHEPEFVFVVEFASVFKFVSALYLWFDV